MRPIDEDTFGPADFEESFAGEPERPPVEKDVIRGRRSRQRRRLVAGSAATIAAVVIAAVAAGQLSGRATTGVPANPAPETLRSSAPTGPAIDRAPSLRYRPGTGYLDQKGRSINSQQPTFQATTRHTYDILRAALDPDQQHLEPYQADASTGGGSATEIQVGQKIGWKSKGDPGEGMILVAIARPAPGKTPSVKASSGMGLCAGTFGGPDTPCRQMTIAGHTVWYAGNAEGQFVMDYIQPDGEVASLLKDPVFLNNTSVAIQSMPITPAQAAQILADPDLDVVG